MSAKNFRTRFDSSQQIFTLVSPVKNESAQKSGAANILELYERSVSFLKIKRAMINRSQ